MKHFIAFLCSLTLLLSAEKLSFHRNFQDHAVLQRDRPIEISGMANPGEHVTVTIKPGPTVTGVADNSGEWKVRVQLPAGGPLSITANSGDQKAVLNDILVGEVWICSGQSNMQMLITSVADGDYIARQLPTLPHIRHFTSRRYTSLEAEQAEPDGKWEVLMPDCAKHTSAIGYLFARQLYRDLQVPIGIIEANWGGMPICSFMSRKTFSDIGRMDVLDNIDAIVSVSKNPPGADQINKLRESTNALIDKWEKRFMASETEADRLSSANWMNPDLDETAWEKLAPEVKNTAFYGDSAPIGIEWFRTSVNIPQEWAGKELLLSLGAIDDADTTYFNGVKVGSIGFKEPAFWEKARLYKVPAKQVKAGRAVIAIREVNSAGASGLFGPKEKWYIALASAPDERIPLTNGWLHRLECKLDMKIGMTRPNPFVNSKPIQQPSQPTTLFNSMLAPWRRYGIRGEIWYQGESDCGREAEYYIHQQAMVADRRAQWKDENYAFLWCQLSGYERHRPSTRGPEDFWKDNDPNRFHTWINFRNMQFLLLKAIPKSGMAVTIDHGDAYDIHPRRKEEVAFRLAKEAERICYGYKGVSAGPYYKSHEVIGNRMILHFDNAGAGLASLDGQPLGCFAIAGADGKYFWAKATIEDDTVVLTSPEVPEPRFASYGAVTYDERLNFGNANGFPASPFFTEKPNWLK